MEYFFIYTEDTGRYYALFYFLAFAAGFGLLIREGRKRKYPTVPWLLVIMTAFLFFMAGSQVIKFSAEDWRQVFRFQRLDHLPARSVLGGILLVVPALIMATYAMRFRYSMMDAFAFVVPIGLIIQRVGCLLAGCCYGRPTTMPWGIKYSAMSHAFELHSLVGVHPYFQYDGRIVGFGLGFHAGSLSRLTGLYYGDSHEPSSMRQVNFRPSASFRVGDVNKFFGELKLAQQFPTNFPSLGFQANLGIGFGKNNGGAFRLGTASFAGLFLAPSFPAGKNLVIEPYVGFLSGFGATYKEESNFTGAFSLRYKFNFKERLVP